MKTKTVNTLALAFAIATGIGFATMCDAEGTAIARDIMNQSSAAFHAAAALGLGLASASLFPALGFGVWREEKAKADRQAPKLT